MTQPFSTGRIDVEITASMERLERTPDPDTPFRILLLGDFSSRSKRRILPTLELHDDREPLEVDRDTVDDVIGRLRPEVELDVPATPPIRLPIRFGALEDFHPDRLFERLEVFHALRNLRRRLHDASAYPAAAAEVRTWIGSDASGSTRAAVPEARESEQSEGQGIVRELLESGERRAREVSPPGEDDWARFVRQLVAPHVVAREDPQRPEFVAAVDRATGALMRAILHHPHFRALEASWRAVDFLVRRLETGRDLQLCLLDLPKEDVAAALKAEDDLRSSWIHRVLVDRTVGSPGGVPWAILAGNYTFDASPEDVEVLSGMVRIARAAGAPFLAAASVRVLGCESLGETPDPNDWPRRDQMETERWNHLRASPEAAYLGLALPRFLLRLPYGKDGEPLETFDFEELPGGEPHDHYLWGNPTFACVCLLGQAFSDQGWRLRPGAVQEVEDLPLHVYEHDGERRVKPCAEVLLTLRAAEIILDHGVMPFLSFRDRDVVRLARFQSLRDPLTALAGRWR